ncbi:MAG: META domain-containing protein [Sphingomonadales bacterium]|nr:META domain-containing protein [Sphingomonadales bacterium]
MRIAAAVAWALMFVASAAPFARAGVLSGEVFYRERVALPADAVLEVSLVDVTRPGGLGELVASMQVRPNRQTPIPFEIRYGDDEVDPRRSYAVRANILADGRLLFVNARPQRVLTHGHPNSVRILMSAVMSVAAAGSNGMVGEEWLAEDIGGRGVVDNVRTTISVGAGGEVTGSGGCNRLRGTAQIDGSSLAFGPMATTRMMCPPAVMDQEAKFLHALDLTREFRLDGPYLKFLDRDGAELVRFTRAR